MTYTWTARYGSDVVLAPALQTLCAEIAIHPIYRYLTNLGEIGDNHHKGQGFASDHNPFVIAPSRAAYPGCGYIRAIDLGGARDRLLSLRAHLHSLYSTHDPRVWVYGYFKGPDSLINDWGGTGWHIDSGDEGHLHVSITQRDGYHPSSSGWVPALDSRRPWGLIAAPPHPHKPYLRYPWPAWMTTGHYFGNIHGSGRSHGGIDNRERIVIAEIQKRFIAEGCVPGVHDTSAGWADGRWESATDAAALRWHQKHHLLGGRQHEITRNTWPILMTY